MSKKSIAQYLNGVASYIEFEYGPDEDFEELTFDEKYAIKQILHSHFDLENSINNAAGDVIDYIRSNRKWIRENKK